jgi:hypothetical protein
MRALNLECDSGGMSMRRPKKGVEWLGVFFGAAAVAVAIWLGLNVEGFTRPKLFFSPGDVYPNSGERALVGSFKGEPPLLTLVYTTADRPETQTVMLLPLTIMNRGRKPLHNVVVRLWYPPEFALRSEDLGCLDTETGDEEIRDLVIRSDYAMAEYELGVVRPGEPLLVYEPLLFTQVEDKPQREAPDLEKLDLHDRLSASMELYGFVRVAAFAAAEEVMPQTADINVIWCKGDLRGLPGSSGITRLKDVIDPIHQAIWGRHLPLPGLYFKWPWERLPLRMEAVETFEPRFLTCTSAGTSYAVQSLPAADDLVGVSSITMPLWDYTGPIDW